jgi:flagellar basal-body rod protein FlgC
MSLFTVFQISSQGMTAQRARLEAAAANLANANTTRTAGGGPYRRRDVVFESTPVEGDGPAPPGVASPFDRQLEPPGQRAQGVRASATISNSVGTARYMPGHPDADAGGYVRMPDVDALEETVNMISAARSFESNATAFNTAKEMVRASLKLGDG